MWFLDPNMFSVKGELPCRCQNTTTMFFRQVGDTHDNPVTILEYKFKLPSTVIGCTPGSFSIGTCLKNIQKKWSMKHPY